MHCCDFVWCSIVFGFVVEWMKWVFCMCRLSATWSSYWLVLSTVTCEEWCIGTLRGRIFWWIMKGFWRWQILGWQIMSILGTGNLWRVVLSPCGTGRQSFCSVRQIMIRLWIFGVLAVCLRSCLLGSLYFRGEQRY